MPRSEPVVAIDGPAGAGKSSAARGLARRLGFVLVDTGAMYRGVALAALESAIAAHDGEALGSLADALELSFVRGSDGTPLLHIAGADRSADIRLPQVSEAASQVAAHPQVRAALLGQQRKLGASGGVVLEGRDIGTVVFPDAEVKVFLTASDETRAKRRTEELQARGQPQPFDEVLREMRERDARDQSREVAPLVPADDATHVDTSGLSLDEVIDRLESLVRTAQPR